MTREVYIIAATMFSMILKGVSRKRFVNRGIESHNSKSRDVKSFPESLDQYNKQKRVMAAFPDVSLFAESASDGEIEKLRTDIYLEWLLLHTNIAYTPPSAVSTISHYKKSRILAPIQCGIPISGYDRTPLPKVLGDGAGLSLMHALENRQDSPEAIIKRFERLSGKKPGDILVSVPAIDDRWVGNTRGKQLEVAVRLCYDPGMVRGMTYADPGCRFVISCVDIADEFYGCTRGLKLVEIGRRN